MIRDSPDVGRARNAAGRGAALGPARAARGATCARGAGRPAWRRAARDAGRCTLQREVVARSLTPRSASRERDAVT